MRRTVLTILAGLAVICAVAVIDVTLLGGDGKVRRGVARDCLTIQEHPTPCGDSDAWYRVTKEKPTSDGCSQGRRRSEDRKRCLDPVFLGDNPLSRPSSWAGASLRGLMRALLIALLALALLAPAAGADDPAQHPPKMPNSTAGAKKCKKASRYGYSFKVFITKGEGRISCKKARKIVAHKLPDVPHYQYFDWTKAGNGPWSDVYYRHDHKVTIGAIIQG